MRTGKVISFIFVGVLLTQIHRFQRSVDHIRLYEKNVPERYFLPQPKVIRTASMGYHHLVAEILWVRSIIVYSDFVMSCQADQVSWLLTMLRAVKSLDPNWRTVYFWGGTMLSLCGDVDGSDEMFIAGAEKFPNDAFFPFSVAMNATIERKDKERALEWMQIAAGKDNAPPWYQAAVAGLMNEGDERAAAIRYLEERLSNESLEPTVRELTEYRLALFLHEEYQSQLEARRSQWEQTNLRSLENLDELGLLPEDPFGVGWVQAPDGRIRSFTLEQKEKAKVIEHERGMLMRKDWEASP